MYQPRTIATVVRQVLKMIYQCVDERSAVVAVTRVYHHTRRFVYQQKAIVFVYYV